MLHLQDIHTYYGASHILQGVSLKVGGGEVVALLGRNGAGKTTTINSIVGFAPPRAGRIMFKGEEVTRVASHQIAQRGIGLVPQGRRIFPDLTVKENILLGARASIRAGRSGAGGRNPWTWERALELFPTLTDKSERRGNQLSGGEQQMMAFARALLTNPDLLLLDEPSEGLAPLIVRDIGRIIGELKESGLSILLIEQNLNLALSLADRVYVMNKGHIVFEGTPQALRASAEIERQYLGV
jgi:branched-chain amino acid transport system ATP-binding protein